jgi:mycothiol synthase
MTISSRPYADGDLQRLQLVNKIGHFEPVGSHQDFRRRGLARAMMLHGLERMRTVGMDAATVEYDASNAPARHLYAGLGFVKRYETSGFRRPAGS